MAKKNILTYGKLAEGFHDFIKEEYEELNCLVAQNKDEISTLLPDCQYIGGFNFLKDQSIDHLEWIHSFGAGVDSFMRLNLPENLKLTKTKGKMGQRMAEYCLTYILEDLNKSNLYNVNQSTKTWDQVVPKSLSKQSVIIFGTGNISTDIAQVLQPLVKNIVGVNTSGKNKEFFDVCVPIEKFEIDNIDPEAIIINTLPATENTYNIFDSSFFSSLQNAFFINIGRGHSVNEDDLLIALDKNQLRNAVLDVFKEEPLPKSSKLWEHSKCIITPHISGITLLEDVKQSFKIAYEAVIKGKSNNLMVDTERGY
ncbi:D-2-hydroxyacid dehydrogenase [Marivirga arenosa]|uniref:D-2-hydroxyacid dehydrogenase n=1 Tax=Marivirga arenosa TaxID=3059076 RepID=A0AA51N586_9BACT|nr:MULTISPECIES: D-2-hydroxyacid dehydrogenase [unclassified Marivirga]WMN06362.1 D-2-hydroxyacid dehydrogenase [Marivirga sp. ABR2-2]WNB17296.1 D-2-hydroxyacid dehydrogenase [Marivirga sp. BKB1-2]